MQSRHATISLAALCACSGLAGNNESTDGGSPGGTDAAGDAGPGAADGSKPGSCAPDAMPQIGELVAATPADSGASPFGATIDGSGRPIVFGYGFRSGDPGNWVFAARMTADRQRDPAYGDDGIARIWPEDFAYSNGMAAAPGPDGTVLIAISISVHNESDNVLLMRLTDSGALDTSFGSGGYAEVFDTAAVSVSGVSKVALAVDGDSAYVFADAYLFNPATPFTPGQDGVFGHRISTVSGARDPSFSFQAGDGTSLIATSHNGDMAVGIGGQQVWKFSGGQLDLSFGEGGSRFFGHNDLALLPDGKLMSIDGDYVWILDPQSDEQTTPLTVEEPEMQRIGVRCDGRPILFMQDDFTVEEMALALLTDSHQFDPSRGDGGLAKIGLDDDEFFSSLAPAAINPQTGRVTLFVRDLEETIYGITVTP